MALIEKVNSPVIPTVSSSVAQVSQDEKAYYIGSCKTVRDFPAFWKTKLECDFDIELEHNAIYRGIIHCSDVVKVEDVDPLRERLKNALGKKDCEIISTRIPQNSNMIVIKFRYTGASITIAIIITAIAGLLALFMLTIKSSSWVKLLEAPAKPLKELPKLGKWVAIGLIAIAVPMTLVYIPRLKRRKALPKPKK